MEINSMKKVTYQILKKIFKKIQDTGWFDEFNSSNIMVFDSKERQFGIAITSTSERNIFGLTYFEGPTGISCLNDMLSLSSNQLLESSFNTMVLNVKTSNELTAQEIFFFDENRIKCFNARKNLTCTTYKEGFAPYVSTKKEVDKMIGALIVFYGVIKDCHDEVLEKFKDKSIQSMLCYVDEEFKEYTLSYGLYPTLLKKTKLRNYKDYELEMLSSYKQSDYDLKLITEHMLVPVKTLDCNRCLTPLLITTKEEGPCDYSYFISPKKDQIEQMLFFFKDYFQSHGKPTRIIFKQPFFHDAFYKLFTKLNIECSIDKTLVCDEFKAINSAFISTFKTTFLDPELEYITYDTATIALNSIKTAINGIINQGDCMIPSDMFELCDKFLSNYYREESDEVEDRKEIDENLDSNNDNSDLVS